MSTRVRFVSDDLIYNRFDIIHENTENYIVYSNDAEYDFEGFIENNILKLNIWEKDIPKAVMDELLAMIFSTSEIYGVEINRTVNNYNHFLFKHNDFRVPLPDNSEALLNRVERRDRATIRRKKRWLDERVGTIHICHYEGSIPSEIVNKYFKWKKSSHGTDYKMSPEEYLTMYYVTDALVLRAGGKDIAISFYCKCNSIAFFENFSYDNAYKDYSPGLLMYEILLEHLIERHVKYLYMAGGNYVYKRRFGSLESNCYSGIVFRKDYMNCLKTIFKKYGIEGEIAIYGFGNYGHIYSPIIEKTGVNILYAIDMKADSEENMQVVQPDSDLSDINTILITLESKNKSVEKIITEKGKRYFYIVDLIKEAKEEYLKSING